MLPGGKVRVEAWFETGDAPHGAKVRVYRADGSPLLPEPGELDKDGAYVFAYEKAEPLKVVISGEGHRKELLIPAAELSSPGTSPPDGGPARERGHEFPIKDLLLGITFLLALAAFVLSLRNARRLRDSRRG